MDQLNYFMRERQLSRALRFSLRDYFQQARLVHQLNSNSELLGRMSPMLQATVATAANVKWLRKVWYLRDVGSTWVERNFIAELAKTLKKGEKALRAIGELRAAHAALAALAPDAPWKVIEKASS